MMSDSITGRLLPRRTSESPNLSYSSVLRPMTDAILPRLVAMSSASMFVAMSRLDTVCANACRLSTAMPSWPPMASISSSCCADVTCVLENSMASALSCSNWASDPLTVFCMSRNAESISATASTAYLPAMRIVGVSDAYMPKPNSRRLLPNDPSARSLLVWAARAAACVLAAASWSVSSRYSMTSWAAAWSSSSEFSLALSSAARFSSFLTVSLSRLYSLSVLDTFFSSIAAISALSSSMRWSTILTFAPTCVYSFSTFAAFAYASSDDAASFSNAGSLRSFAKADSMESILAFIVASADAMACIFDLAASRLVGMTLYASIALCADATAFSVASSISLISLTALASLPFVPILYISALRRACSATTPLTSAWYALSCCLATLYPSTLLMFSRSDSHSPWAILRFLRVVSSFPVSCL